MKKIFSILFAAMFLWQSAAAEDVRIPVQTRRSDTNEWHTEKALTISGIEGFTPGNEPEQDRFGGWMTSNLGATGFFRTAKVDGRWWIVTPDGHPFISKAVTTLSVKSSRNQNETMLSKYGSSEAWLEAEVAYLHDNGFNSVGAWSDTRLIHDTGTHFPYCVIISPLKKFEAARYPEVNSAKVALVFDKELENAVAEAMKEAERYKDDPWCIGYFIDNEIPWRNSLLEYYLNELDKRDPNHIAAVKWMKKNKVRTICASDREKFAAYVFGHYQEMVVRNLRRHDPNHMYLGCRFNMWTDELANKYLFAEAGKYMDIISINHYAFWEPYWRRFDNWERWSGKPSMVTEFYTKGMDSGMENKSGAGWCVPTQKDRGYFYQNFVINLLKSRSCVGWQWFKYIDNDPENKKADPSNRNSNKGIVNNALEHYDELVSEMKAVNNQVWNLVSYLDGQQRKGCITLIDDDFKLKKVVRYKEILDSLDIRCTFAAIPGLTDGREQFGKEARQYIRQWQREGYSFALHPSHQCWYDNAKGTNHFTSAQDCQMSLEASITAYRKAGGRNVSNYLVYPGGSGNNEAVVKMAGKYVGYGIGGSGCAKINGGPVQIERIFINPTSQPAAKYKEMIRDRIEKGEYVIIGTHSWQFGEHNYDYLIDILSYCKTIAEFRTLQEGIGAYL